MSNENLTERVSGQETVAEEGKEVKRSPYHSVIIPASSIPRVLYGPNNEVLIKDKSEDYIQPYKSSAWANWGKTKR